MDTELKQSMMTQLTLFTKFKLDILMLLRTGHFHFALTQILGLS